MWCVHCGHTIFSSWEAIYSNWAKQTGTAMSTRTNCERIFWKFALPEKQQTLLAELDEALTSQQPRASYEITRIYWDTFLRPSSRTVIDFHGSEKVLKFDLNSPIDLKRQFDIVHNCGTLEHIFNDCTVLQNCSRSYSSGGAYDPSSPICRLGWTRILQF